MNIRYPKITGTSVPEQIAQIRSFLHQLVDQLNYAPNAGGTEAAGSIQTVTEQQYNELRAFVMQEIRRLQSGIETLATSVQSIADHSVGGITFTLDEEGNLYYEIEEE